MKIESLALITLMGGLVSLPMSVTAEPDYSCLKSAWQAEIDIQLALQDEIAGIVIAARPDLQEIAELSAAQGKQNINATHAMRAWIWETDPARLNTLEAHTSFSWTDDDRAAWAAAGPKVVAIMTRFDDLTAQLASHPDGLGYFAFLSEEPQQAQMREITQKLGGLAAEASVSTADCY